ncbi:UxaA family hydrolase [Algibacillus agarilyticus]|uniref:UxaA family hydrolase n=1 Tax=Algibacillus agarilyticus TaxID=2234133 RepID=UPI000DD08226|nr:altronate dehydratase family protein [Algibacillus agarilyticus]
MSHSEIRTVIQVHPDDNVLVAIQTIPSNTQLPSPWQHITTQEEIPAGHKMAITAIEAEQSIYKYGYSIGHATQAINAGCHIHSHNLKTNLSGDESYQYNAYIPPELKPQAAPTFEGYLRKNGKVGIRNEIWIINTVGCVNQAAKRISDLCMRRYSDKADAFVALTHPFGCSQLGDDLSNTRKLLASLMQHPNAGGVVVIGLGCENNQLATLLAEATGLDEDRIRYFNSQQVDDEIEHGITQVEALLNIMQTDKRTTQPVTKLALGMKCGGSDGFSGLTANAVVGRISDKLTQFGGRVILTETPEMFGAEQVLMDRSSNQSIFEQTVDLVQNFKQYFIDNNQPIYENPSPGNKAGGLTTLEEKSLGAIQKGGKATVNEVIAYGENASLKAGLTLLEGPGNDAVSSTALAAAGANIVLFTTGRGTPLGFPVPTVKISSNSGIYQKKPHWIDFNAGKILDSDIDIDQCADELFDYLLQVASGKLTNNEINESREISIWKNGVTL